MTSDLTIEMLQKYLDTGKMVCTHFTMTRALIAAIQRETELRNALEDITRMDTEFQSLEMAMDIAKAVIASEYPAESEK